MRTRSPAGCERNNPSTAPNESPPMMRAPASVLQPGSNPGVCAPGLTSCSNGGEDEFHTTMDELTGPDVEWEFYHHGVALQSPLDSPTYTRIPMKPRRR